MEICEAGKKDLFVEACCEPVESSLALEHRVSLMVTHSKNGGHIWTNLFFPCLTSRLFTAHLCQNTPHLIF